MTQWEYETIRQIVQYGAPALSNVLIKSLQDLIADYQTMKKIIEDQNMPIEEKNNSEEN